MILLGTLIYLISRAGAPQSPEAGTHLSADPPMPADGQEVIDIHLYHRRRN